MTRHEIREEIEHLEQTRDRCESFIRGYEEGLRQVQAKIDALKDKLEQA